MPVRPSVNWNRPLGCHHSADLLGERRERPRRGYRHPERHEDARCLGHGSRSRWAAKAVELLGPAPLGVVEPAPQLGHRRRTKGVDPDAGVEVGVGLGDQAVLAQHPQVLAHRRRRGAELAGELAGPSRSLCEQLDRSTPDGVGQRGQRVVETGGRRLAHCQSVAMIGCPMAASASARVTSRTWVENVQQCPSGSSGPVGAIAVELVLRVGCDDRTGGPRPLAVLVEIARQLHVNRLGVRAAHAGGAADPLRPLGTDHDPPPSGAAHLVVAHLRCLRRPVDGHRDLEAEGSLQPCQRRLRIPIVHG